MIIVTFIRVPPTAPMTRLRSSSLAARARHTSISDYILPGLEPQRSEQ